MAGASPQETPGGLRVEALLVYPQFPTTYWSHQYSLKFTGKKCLLPPLGLVTVAAMLPSHWRPTLVDLNIEPVSDRQLKRADVVMLTGMQVQRQSVHEVLARCRKLGVPTVIGGPYVTGEPHLLDDADHLVLGETEGTLAGFCEAFEAGRAPRITPPGEAPDMTTTPVPRYDLLRRGAYFHLSLQYSRGCPFTCEFCDIIVMFGRKPRTKSSEQVCRELDAIHATGFRGSVFFVDDNFIGNKKAVRGMLPELKEWQERRGWPFAFYTEASLNIAEDSTLMQGMTRAGFDSVFIGIESPSEESLAEAKKGQNIKGSLVDRVHEVLRHGLDVWGGFIVGFDNDGPDIFDRQIEFIEEAAIPFAMVGILQALPNTPLETRLRTAGRLRPLQEADQFGRTNFETNLPEAQMLSGYRRILETIYEPGRYFSRVLAMMGHRKDLAHLNSFQPQHLWWGLRALMAQGIFSSYRKEYWRFLREARKRHPSRLVEAIQHGAAGHHFIEYTRRVVLPRLYDGSQRLAAAKAALAAGARQLGSLPEATTD